MAERKGWPISQRAADMEKEQTKAPVGMLRKTTIGRDATKKKKS
jgi:hypothetical protein